MPPSPDAPVEVAGLVERLIEAIRAGTFTLLPQLLDADQSAVYCGQSRSNFYRLLAAQKIPQPVRVDGTGPRWRRADLDKWIASLKPGRRKPV